MGAHQVERNAQVKKSCGKFDSKASTILTPEYEIYSGFLMIDRIHGAWAQPESSMETDRFTLEIILMRWSGPRDMSYSS